MRGAVGEVLKAFNYFLVFWMTSRLVETELHARRVLQVLFWAGLGVALIGLGAAAGRIPYPGAFAQGEIMSTFQYPNTLAVYLTMTTVFGLALLVRTDRLWLQSLYAAALLPMLVVILCTMSRGGWMLFPVALTAFCIGLPRSCRALAVYTLLVDLGAALFVARSFVPQVLQNLPLSTGKLLLPGLAAVVLAQVIYRAAVFVLDKYEVAPRVRSWLVASLIVYLGITGIFYYTYAAQALPSVAAQFVPVAVLRQLERMDRYDPSFTERLRFDLDALKIVRDHPWLGTGGGGWNALYHQYQPYLYWTTEVHNHFLQVWVEAGTLGFLLFVAAWFCFGRGLYRVWRSVEEAGLEGDPAGEGEAGAWVFPWANGVAALALGLHSAFDFNLSLPAMALILWALFGLGQAFEREICADPEAWQNPRGGRGRNRPRSGGAEDRSSENPSENPSGWQLARAALAGTLAAALLFLPAANLYAAGKTGAAGARALLRHDFEQARALFRRAHRLDPFTASYLGDLAQVYTVLGLKQRDPSLLLQARDYAVQAAKREPYNWQLRATLITTYFLQGFVDKPVQEAEALLQTNPWLTFSYETLAGAYVTAAQQHLARHNGQKARDYLEKARGLPALLEARRATVKEEMLPRWKGEPLAPSPGLYLATGQAAYLLGDYEAAGRDFSLAAGDPRLKQEADLWRAATEARRGRDAEARRILRELEKVSSVYRTRYSQILALGPAR